MTLVLLHYLGGSARGFSAVVDRLKDRFSCRPLDLPGFGDAAGDEGFTVAAMADAIERAIADETPKRWAVVGHSMGAKVAAVLARRAEDGAAGLRGLVGVVLLAGSPPGPEPMEESRRRTMLGWFTGDPPQDRTQAQGFIDANIASRLPEPVVRDAVADVLRADKGAWRAWLADGSREDWREHIGILKTPALIVAGAEDGDLGPEAQRRLVGAHFADARHAVLAGAKHLLPQERPDEVARLIAEHIEGRGGPALDPHYRALIDSDRVGARTRTVLLGRLTPKACETQADVFTAHEREILRAVLDRVVPQRGVPIDLTAIIERGLADGDGDGWRFADLPPDAEAYAAALRTLDRLAGQEGGVSFARAEPASQDALLDRIAAGLGTSESKPDGLDAKRLALWFEDLRSDAVKAYVSHPTVMARIGFSGIATGGDGSRKQAFVRVGTDQREPWEPRASRDHAP